MVSLVVSRGIWQVEGGEGKDVRRRTRSCSRAMGAGNRAIPTVAIAVGCEAESGALSAELFFGEVAWCL